MKTNAEIIIPVNEIAIELLQKYNYRLPQISNQKFNDYIKEVASMIESFHENVQVKITKGGKLQTNYIEKYKLIASHTARRTAATNMYLSGIDSISIMRITGHKTESSFMRYIRISDVENAYRLFDNPFFNNKNGGTDREASTANQRNNNNINKK